MYGYCCWRAGRPKTQNRVWIWSRSLASYQRLKSPSRCWGKHFFFKKSFSGRYTLRESRCRILHVLVPILPKGNIMDVIYALSADGWVFVEGSPVPYVVDSDLSNELSNLYFFLVPSRSVTIASVGPHQRSPQLALDAISSSTPNRPPCDPLPVVPVAIFDSDSNVVPRPTLAFSVVETRSLESAREDHGGCISSNNFTSSSETCSIHTFSSRWPWDREL